MPALAFIGFGELGTALAAAAHEAGAAPLRAWSRSRADPDRAAALRERMLSAGAEPAAELDQALAGTEAAFVCVPGGAAEQVAERAAPALARGALYVDLATAPPSVKERSNELVAAAGGRYVDAAVLGTVAASGAAVPILVAGPSADAFRELAEGLHLRVTTLDAPVGAAARVKLLRSVYLKGRDALVAEMMLAARRHGLDAAVAETIAGPGEEVPFPSLADRVLRSLALHAGRRAAELEESAELLEETGVDPVASRGGAERLRRLAELGLRERFGAERPEAGDAVLEEILRQAGARERRRQPGSR